MTLPKYALGQPKNRLVNILCRGACNGGRWARLLDNGNNDQGTKITSSTHAECLRCGYIALDPSNWRRAK